MKKNHIRKTIGHLLRKGEEMEKNGVPKIECPKLYPEAENVTINYIKPTPQCRSWVWLQIEHKDMGVCRCENEHKHEGMHQVRGKMESNQYFVFKWSRGRR